MSGPAQVDDNDLHAFLDGELSPERSNEIAHEIGRNPSLSERVAAFRRDKDLLAGIYGPLTARPLPAAWLERIERRRSYARLPRSALALASIAATILLLLGAITYYTYRPSDPMLAEALAASRQTAVAEQHLAGTAIQTAGGPDQVLAGALRTAAKVPDLSSFGFRLVGIDVFERKHGVHAVNLTYRNVQGHDFTIYVRGSDGSARFDLLKQGSLRVCIWQDDAIAAVMMGEMPAGEMMRIASRAYSDLGS
jgi:anti-sigma factor RsiW